MRYDGECIVNGAFAVRMQVKIHEETEWREGDRAQIPPRLVPGEVVETSRRKRRGKRERMLGCAALQERREVKKERQEEAVFVYLVRVRISFENSGPTKRGRCPRYPAENSSLLA